MPGALAHLLVFESKEEKQKGKGSSKEKIKEKKINCSMTSWRDSKPPLVDPSAPNILDHMWAGGIRAGKMSGC